MHGLWWIDRYTVWFHLMQWIVLGVKKKNERKKKMYEGEEMPQTLNDGFLVAICGGRRMRVFQAASFLVVADELGAARASERRGVRLPQTTDEYITQKKIKRGIPENTILVKGIWNPNWQSGNM